MTIIIKNKETLIWGDFKFRCSVGKKGFTKNKCEGDKKTPSGTYNIGNLYYRRFLGSKIDTELKSIPIKKDMGWCNDSRYKKKYNKLIKINKKIKYEKLYRNDGKYDLLIPILYNTNKVIPGKGSAIFIHLTKNYGSTLGCIALKRNDFLVLLRLINKNTKIKIL